MLKPDFAPYAWYHIFSKTGILLDTIRGDAAVKRKMIYYSKIGIDVQAVRIYKTDKNFKKF